MPDRLTDVKAEFLLDQANRRARLLGTVQKTHPRYWVLPTTQPITTFLVGAMLGLMLVQAMFRETDLISSVIALAVLSIISIAIDVATLNKRMDALVKLLREDGVLQSTPPAAKLLNRQ